MFKVLICIHLEMDKMLFRHIQMFKVIMFRHVKMVKVFVLGVLRFPMCFCRHASDVQNVYF